MLRRVEEAAHGGVAARGVEVALGDARRPDRDLLRLEGVPVPGEALGRGGVGDRRVGHARDVAMAELDEMRDRAARRGPVIDVDTRDDRAVERALEDDGEPLG